MNKNPIEERKLAFYQRVRKATGLSDAEIRQFLSERYDKYDPNQEKEYLHGLYMWGKLQHHVKKEAKKPKALTCPICGEIAVDDKDWGWICSKGGVRHRIVSTVSRMSGIPSEKILARLEEFDANKESLIGATREAEERSEIRFQLERQGQESNQAGNQE